MLTQKIEEDNFIDLKARLPPILCQCQSLRENVSGYYEQYVESSRGRPKTDVSVTADGIISPSHSISPIEEVLACPGDEEWVSCGSGQVVSGDSSISIPHSIGNVGPMCVCPDMSA